MIYPRHRTFELLICSCALSLGLALPAALAQEDAAEAVPESISTHWPKPSLKVTVAPLATAPAFLVRAANLGLPEASLRSPYSKSYELNVVGPDLLSALGNSGAIRSIELVFPDEIPTAPVRVPFNRDARLSHNVGLFETNFHDGGGKDTTILVLDDGSVRASHVEFQTNRVSLIDADAEQKAHATHVAGTIGASGAHARARGMAPRSMLVSGTFYDDLEKLERIAPRVQVSNHSYGPPAGWAEVDGPGGPVWRWSGDENKSKVEDIQFGRYTSDCAEFDRILLTNPLLTAVIAVGNDRNDAPPFQPIEHIVARYGAGPRVEWARSSEVRNPDASRFGGVDTISGLGTCKNGLAVGAINDQFSSGLASAGPGVTSTVFSSWGPTDDGRIKPDVVANGQALVSATLPPDGASHPDAVYESMSGTSMASPTAAGIVAIVAEYYQLQRGSKPSSAMMRALLTHSAKDAGRPGPDATFGYGVLDAFRAGELVKSPGGALLLESRIGGESRTTLRARANGKRIRIALAWIDPPGLPASGPINDRTASLVNNLDVQAVDPAGAVHYPFSLDPEHPLSPATATRPNHVDNLEIIEPALAAGDWEIRISAPNLRAAAGGQSYALIVTGLTLVSPGGSP